MGAPRHNVNARKGRHPRVLVGLSGELLDSLYQCLEAEGRCITQDDPQAIRNYALAVLSGHARRVVEQHHEDAIIL